MPAALTAERPPWSPWADMKKMTAGLLATALLMMGFGLWRGGGAAVLSKGINLCTECVRIG